MFYFLFSVKTSIITPIKAIIPKGILHKIKNGAMKINIKRLAKISLLSLLLSLLYVYIMMNCNAVYFFKKDIEIFNSLLKEDFSCVNNGNCCGDMSFQKFAETHYGQTYSDKVLDSKCFLASFEKTVLCIFKKYGVDFLNKKILYNWSIGFNYSVLKKTFVAKVSSSKVQK